MDVRATSLGKWSGGNGYAPVVPVKYAPQSGPTARAAGQPVRARVRQPIKVVKKSDVDLPKPLVPMMALDPGKQFAAVDLSVVEKQEKAALAALPEPLVPPNVLNRDLKVVRFRIVEN